MGRDAQMSLVELEGGKARPGRKASAKRKSGNGQSGKAVPVPSNGSGKAAAAPGGGGGGKKRSRKRVSAERVAEGQRDISVSEFFVKNRHLLGFDSPSRALLTTVKEAVDNALDACEEAGIPPTIMVELQHIADDRYIVAVQDNGPGIVKKHIPKIFGKLLYGSKFHRLKQSRGQQGIGISAAAMYGQLTTGKPVVITSRTGKGRPAHHFEIVINTQKNKPEVIADSEVEWEESHGTRVEIEMQGTYKGGRRSVDEYLEQTALANPHAEIFYFPPKGREPSHYARLTDELPPDPVTIKPHPYGVELGILMKMLKETKSRTLSAALKEDFSRVSPKVAEQICKTAKLSSRARPSRIANREVEALFNAIPRVKIQSPKADCIVPIGEELVLRGLEHEIKGASFYTCRTRSPRVYRGNPFQVEVGLAYGGQLTGLIDHGHSSADGAWVGGTKLVSTKKIESALIAVPGLTRKKAVELLLNAGVDRKTKVGMLSGDELQRLRDALDQVARSEAASRSIQLVRLANRVPLQYQQSACAIHKAVTDVNWRRYGLGQSRGALPTGPVVLVVHIASVWVPFTSESKEAIAHYPEIIDEIKKGLQDCGRDLGNYVRKREKGKAAAQRRGKFDLYCGELAESLHRLTGRKRTAIAKILGKAANRHAPVAIVEADLEMGEEAAKNGADT